MQVYKLPAGIVPILVPANSDELKQDSSSLQQLLSTNVQAQQLSGVIPNNPSSIPAMNCALINRSNTPEKCDGSNLAQPLNSTIQTGNNPKEESKSNRATECSIKDCKECAAESSIHGLPASSTMSGFVNQTSTHRVDSQIENPPQTSVPELTSELSLHSCEQVNAFSQQMPSCSSAYDRKTSSETCYIRQVQSQHQMQEEGSQRMTTTLSNQNDLLRKNVDPAAKQAAVQEQLLQPSYIPESPQQNAQIYLQQNPEMIGQPSVIPPSPLHCVQQQQPTSYSSHPTPMSIESHNIDTKSPEIASIQQMVDYQQQQYTSTPQITAHHREQLASNTLTHCVSTDAQNITQPSSHSLSNIDTSAHVFTSSGNAMIYKDSGLQPMAVVTREKHLSSNHPVNQADLSVAQGSFAPEAQPLSTPTPPNTHVVSETAQQAVARLEALAHHQLCETCGSISVVPDGSSHRPLEDYQKGSYDSVSSQVHNQEQSKSCQKSRDVAKLTVDTQKPIPAQEVSKPILIAPQNTPSHIHNVKSFTTMSEAEVLEDIRSDKNVQLAKDVESGNVEILAPNQEEIQDASVVTSDSRTVSQNVIVDTVAGNTSLPSTKRTNETHPFSAICSDTIYFPYFASKSDTCFDSINRFCSSSCLPYSYDFCALHAIPPAPPPTPISDPHCANIALHDVLNNEKVGTSSNSNSLCDEIRNLNGINVNNTRSHTLQQMSYPLNQEYVSSLATPNLSSYMHPRDTNQTDHINCKYHSAKHFCDYQRQLSDSNATKHIRSRQQEFQKLCGLNGIIKSSSTESISVSGKKRPTSHVVYQTNKLAQLNTLLETQFDSSYKREKSAAEIPNLLRRGSLPISSASSVRRASAGYLPMTLAPLHEQRFSTIPTFQEELQANEVIMVIFSLEWCMPKHSYPFISFS